MKKKQIYVWKNFVAVLAITAVLAVYAQASARNENASRTVPKKEFAEMLAELLNAAGNSGKCYKDLDKSDKTTAVICGLKKIRVFWGSKNSKFYPNSKTNYGFAIKSLCRAQNWTPKKTFQACTVYARKNGFLDAPLPKKIKSKTKIPYNKLALLTERAAAGKSPAPSQPQTSSQPQGSNPPAPIAQKQNQQTDAPKIPPREYPSLTFTPFPEKTIAADAFANIRLTAPLPNHFYLDEVYFIEGDLVNSTEKEVFIFLCPDKLGCDNSENFIEKAENGRFKIPVYFKKLGNYQIGIIPGREGQSRVEDVSVLLDPPQQANAGARPTEFSVGYAAGKTTFRWNGDGVFTRLIFFQNNRRADYLFRQGIKAFAPPSKDFEYFKKGEAGWTVQQNESVGEIRTLNLTVQEFYKIEKDAVQTKSLPEFWESDGRFEFQGKSLKPIAKKAAFTLPNGQVTEITFADKDLDAQKDFTIEFLLAETGTYIFEVNDPDGSAAINVPIYVGNFIPLLPDFFALHEPALDVGSLEDLGQARHELLVLINADRAANNASPVTLAADLNSIAQAHSADMVVRNFFGHVNPSGETPDNRRKNAKIPVPIKENLGKAGTLDSAEAGLMRSPIHRAAIIDPEMTRVGIGIAKDDEGYLLVTQNFSADPLAQSALPAVEDQLFQDANSYRGTNGMTYLSHDSILRGVARDWSVRMAANGFFSVTEPSSGQKLVDLLRGQGVNSSVNMHIVEVSDKSLLKNQILSQAGLTDAGNNKMGIGLAVNEIGEISMTVVYAP